VEEQQHFEIRPLRSCIYEAQINKI